MNTQNAPKSQSLQLKNGSMCFLRTNGEGTPIVLLHSLGNSGRSFEKLMAVSNSPMIAPDLFGFGESSMNGRVRIKGHAQDVLELMDALNVKKFYVAGNSFGGDIALEMALQAPDRVLGTISLNGGGVTLETPWFMKMMLRAPLSTLLFSNAIGPGLWKSYMKGLYRNDSAHSPELLEQRFGFLKQKGRMRELLENLKCLDLDRAALDTRIQGMSTRSLVIYGEKDPEFSVQYGKTLALAIGAEFTSLPQAGHLVHEDDPEGVWAEMEKWVEKKVNLAA